MLNDATKTDMRSPDDLLSTDESTYQYNLPPKLLINLRQAGGGPPFIKVSHRCVRYRRSDIDAWLKERTKRSTQSA